MQSNKNSSTGVNAGGEDQVTPSLQKGHWLVLQTSSLAEEILVAEWLAALVTCQCRPSQHTEGGS
jgi:hypothetical protein